MDEKSIFSNLCFTSFGEEEPKFNMLKMFYLVYQQELSPSTGNMHYQGYVEFVKPTSYRKAKFLLGLKSMPHFENRKGQQHEAILYCKKDKSRMPNGIRGEHGEPKRQGERSDLASIQEAVLGGMTLAEILREFPSAMRLTRCIKDAIEAVWGDYEGDRRIRKHRESIRKAYIEGGGENEDLLDEMLRPPY